jgi:ELWxxDGT repeat protein
MRLRGLLPCALLGFLAVPAQGQPAFLVRDLNTDTPSLGAGTSLASESAGDLFYFTVDDGPHGLELWRSDGTPAGTFLLRDIAAGAFGSSPDNLTAFQGKLFFRAWDYRSGFQGIWKSDGTPEGTALLVDPAQVRANGDFMAEGDRLFFSGGYGDYDVELWVTDGSAAGTHLVRDIFPGPLPSLPHLLAAGNGKVLFAADDGVHGMEPWITDGTTGGTRILADLRPGPLGSLLSYNAAASGSDAVATPWGFAFVADDGTLGSELWVTNGTTAGTLPLQDTFPGPAGSSPYGLTALGGTVVFAATDPTIGTELWRTNGTPAGTAPLKDVWPGTSSSRPLQLTAVGSRVLFRAADGVHGEELWATDGTAAGTAMVREIVPGAAGAFSPPFAGVGDYGFTRLGDRLFFFAFQDGAPALWQSDGTAAGTQPVPSPDPNVGWPQPSGVSRLFDAYGAAGGQFFFRAGTYGEEIWVADGTPAGSRQARGIALPTSAFAVYNALPITFGTLAGLGDKLLFQASDGHTGLELWRSDGTAAGTSQVLDLSGGIASSYPQQLHTAGGRLFFTVLGGDLGVSDGTPGGTGTLPGSSVLEIATAGGQAFFLSLPAIGPQGLWKTDGTAAGTVPLQSHEWLVTPAMMTASGGKLFYHVYDGAGYGLWVSDGTAAGTLNLDPGPQLLGPWNLTDAGGTLFFTSEEPGTGRELWKSDGTKAGTVRVKDIQPGPGSSCLLTYTLPFASLPGGVVLFPADAGGTGTELWRSDGTEAGTTLVKEVFPGPSGSAIQEMIAAAGKVFFLADDGTHGQELWVSDGTAAGTHLVKELVPGPGIPLLYNQTAAGPVLVFTAYDPAHGVEAWRSDGTALGTRRLQDIAPGPLSSSPLSYTVVGDRLFFVADDNATGFELWSLPLSALRATFEDVPTTFWAWSSVEAIAAAGITLGCEEGLYCPDRILTRAETGVFLGRALHGPGFTPPPATGTRFADVPASYWAADWIEQIAADGITQGCAVSPARYCPESHVARAEMAVFLLRARHGGSYVPPPATGTRFADVPASYWAAPWIEQLAAEGITSGCGVGLYCPDRTVGRSETAVFLTRAFDLPLP